MVRFEDANILHEILEALAFRLSRWMSILKGIE